MLQPDSRAAALQSLTALAREFGEDAASRFERGERLADRDTRRLDVLAVALAADLKRWSAALEGLEVALETRLAPRRAGRLLIESVFDDVLTPAATRLLSASLDLALANS